MGREARSVGSAPGLGEGVEGRVLWREREWSSRGRSGLMPSMSNLWNIVGNEDTFQIYRRS